MKRIFAFLLGFLFCLQLFAQTKTVTGQVTDEKGAPLPGVSVQPKTGSGGSTTDANGRFSLTIPSSVTALLFSYSGMGTQEISIANQATLNVSMRAGSQPMDEVVVVGYGAQRGREITG